MAYPADDEAIAALTTVRGVGVWSAQAFLIRQLHRPDVLPAGDTGIRRAIRDAWNSTTCPPWTRCSRQQPRGRRTGPTRPCCCGDPDNLWANFQTRRPAP
jgi:hypothetical protein